jgi:glycosyltransferase involved in cell wall biosynthesis
MFMLGGMELGSDQRRISVAFFDEAVAFGGSVVVLSHLVQNLDRTRYLPLVVTSLDLASIEKLFRPEDVLCRFRPPMNYANRVRWMALCPSNFEWANRIWAYLFTVVSMVVNLPEKAWLHYKIWRSKPDIVHVNNGRDGLIVARRFNIPLLYHFHGMFQEMLLQPYDSRQTAAAFVSISKHITSEAIKCGVPPDKIIDIPNPAPVVTVSAGSRQTWRRKFRFADDAIVLAHVGRLVSWKGQIEFVKAFAQIARKYPHVIALIVGDDLEGLESAYPKALRKLVIELGMEKQVVFSGHVEDILGLMSAMDVVVHSSISPEPFGLVITEAMAAGAAVIGARLGAPIEIIEEGVSGLLVNPNDAEEFAAGLERLISDKSLRERLASSGRKRALEVYSPKLFASRVEEIYARIASSAR